MDSRAHNKFNLLCESMVRLRICKEISILEMNPELIKWLKKVEINERNVLFLWEMFKNLKHLSRDATEKQTKRAFHKLENMITIQKGAVEALIEEKQDILDTPSERLAGLFDKLERENPQPYPHTDIKKFTENFSEKLGSGAFGSVYKGQNHDGVPLAIKVLKENRWDIIENQLEAEVVTMGRTHHRNLIKLYGFCYNASMKALVYEYMENGSFDVILSKNHLDLQKLYSIAIGIAKGISYLHEGCNPQIIHFDIKPANVLLDADFCPKLIDFGLSMLRIENSEFTEAGIRGTPGYVAPEMTQLEPVTITCKCDVYSFGMILFDILASKRNSAGQRWFPGEVWVKFQENQLDSFIKDCGIIKKEDELKAKTFATVALLCAEHEPQDRPSMSVVANMLEGVIQPWKPVNPFQYYDPLTENSTIGGSRN